MADEMLGGFFVNLGHNKFYDSQSTQLIVRSDVKGLRKN